MSSTQKHRRASRRVAHVALAGPWPRHRLLSRTPANFPRMKDRGRARRERAAAARQLPGLLAGFSALRIDFTPLADAFKGAGDAVGEWLAHFRQDLLYPVPEWHPGSPPAVNIVQPPSALAPISAPDQVGGNPEGDTPS